MCDYVVSFTFRFQEQENKRRSWNFERGLRPLAQRGTVGLSTDVDVGNPRRPFGERSAKILYRALKDVEAAMEVVDGADGGGF